MPPLGADGLANDWDGYAGEVPKSSALGAEVLRQYGYSTAGFGKWHNTPAIETTAAGPFDNWPTGIGFEYFYGFLAGEASQYEPNLVRNTEIVLPPRTPEEGYHLSEDLADDAIDWLQKHKAFQPDKPFFLYRATGCLHGPHHVMKEWADRYAGKFDDGWNAYRERVHARAIERGWIPADAEPTPRASGHAGVGRHPGAERPFQRRLMEVAAGFAEHADVQAGRLVDAVEDLGYGENTLVFYIWGDNGSSGEGQNGTISELLAQNGIPTTVDMRIKALDELGGLDVVAHVAGSLRLSSEVDLIGLVDQIRSVLAMACEPYEQRGSELTDCVDLVRCHRRAGPRQQVPDRPGDHGVLSGQPADRTRQSRRRFHECLVETVGSLGHRDVSAEVGRQLSQGHVDLLGPRRLAARRRRGQRQFQRRHRLGQFRTNDAQTVQSRVRSADDRFHQRLPSSSSMVPPCSACVQSSPRCPWSGCPTG